MKKDIATDAKSNGGSLGDASVKDLEQGFVSLEQGSPRKAMYESWGMKDDNASEHDGGVLGRPEGFER